MKKSSSRHPKLEPLESVVLLSTVVFQAPPAVNSLVHVGPSIQLFPTVTTPVTIRVVASSPSPYGSSLGRVPTIPVIMHIDTESPSSLGRVPTTPIGVTTIVKAPASPVAGPAGGTVHPSVITSIRPLATAHPSATTPVNPTVIMSISPTSPGHSTPINMLA